jgi:hypothetical protein
MQNADEFTFIEGSRCSSPVTPQFVFEELPQTPAPAPVPAPAAAHCKSQAALNSLTRILDRYGVAILHIDVFEDIQFVSAQITASYRADYVFSDIYHGNTISSACLFAQSMPNYTVMLITTVPPDTFDDNGEKNYAATMFWARIRQGWPLNLKIVMMTRDDEAAVLNLSTIKQDENST